MTALVWSGYSEVTGLKVADAVGHETMVGPSPAPPDIEGVVWFEGAHASQAFRLSGGVLIARTAVTPVVTGTAVADGVTELSIAGLPVGAEIILIGPAGVVPVRSTLASNPLEVTFTVAGSWVLHAHHRPTYQDISLPIEVAAP